jgi:hypothetical protein
MPSITIHRLPLGVLIAAILAGVSSGCCCTFERDWRAAQQCGVPSDQLAGLWEGTWESHYNGHNGKLRAIITNCGGGQYHARYHATFVFVVPYAYDTTHSAVDQGGVTYFSGVQDLGCLAGGVYHYNGYADYRADKDYGVFRMRRVGSCGGCGCDCVPTMAAAR